MSRFNPLLTGEVRDLVDRLLSKAQNANANPDSHSPTDLERKQLEAVLLHCQSLLVFIESPELVYPVIDQISALRKGNEDDFLLLKYLVKTMCGYTLPNEISFYDSDLLKARITTARPLEKELAEKHRYKKYRAHLDYLEVIELSKELPFADFDRLVRPYLMSCQVGNKRWEVLFRLQHIGRVQWLLKKSIRIEKNAKVEEQVLEDDSSGGEKMPYKGLIRH